MTASIVHGGGQGSGDDSSERRSKYQFKSHCKLVVSPGVLLLPGARNPASSTCISRAIFLFWLAFYFFISSFLKIMKYFKSTEKFKIYYYLFSIITL